MKSKIVKFMGVGLTVALLASLLAFAAPVSARTLGWSTETIPGDPNDVIEAGVNVTDIAVSADGNTIYAGGGAGILYKSTNRGVSWSDIDFDTATGNDTDLVAIAPDDSDIVAVADTGLFRVWVTTNGGTNWGSIGLPQESGGAACTGINDIAISAESNGTHYVAVAGIESGPQANVWYYNIGSAAPAWVETNDKNGFAASTSNSTAVAVAFSPNFPSDNVLAAVTADWGGTDADTDYIYLELFSLTSTNLQWNAEAGFDAYEAVITSDDAITGVTTGSISLDPEYLGSDDSMRLCYIGLTVAGNNTEATGKSGIYRMSDVLSKDLKVGTTVDIESVAYDGSILVAGEYGSNTCYYCTDPTVSTPTVSTTRSLKRPGIDGVSTVTVLAWAGGDVVAGVSTQGAFSVSHNSGQSYNDISLISQAITDLTDIQVTPDGSTRYLLGDNGTYVSLWRYASAWERVLAFANANDFIIRMAPDDADVVYVAQKSGTTAYYTSDGGVERWQTRTCGVSIEDLAIEGDGSVAYALTSAGRVSKSSNGGFTWASSKSTGYTTGNMIVSAGEGNVLVGTNDGYVSYSTDSGDTWTKIVKQIGDTSAEVSAIATGLADNDFIYAALESATAGIYRWQIGVSSAAWTTIYTPASTDNMTTYGIAMEGGALYVQTATATASTIYRTLSPSASPTAYVSWSTLASTAVFNTEPQGLRISSGSAKLWALNSETADTLYSYTDTLLGVSPTILSPADGYIVKVNPLTGYAQDIILSWEKPSDEVTAYETWVALDASFAERVKIITTSSPSPTPSQPVGKDVTDGAFSFMPGEVYYWKVRVSSTGPIYSSWSEVRSFTVAEAEVTPPVEITTTPAPQITVTIPDVVVNIPPTVEVPAATTITPGWIYGIIAIGAILVIAVIILIVRTRRAT